MYNCILPDSQTEVLPVTAVEGVVVVPDIFTSSKRKDVVAFLENLSLRLEADGIPVLMVISCHEFAVVG